MIKQNTWSGVLRPAWVLAVMCLGAGCGNSSKSGPPPMVVHVVAVAAKQQPVTDMVSVVGTAQPNEFVEIKSEIDGRVEKISFDEGQPVTKGQLLLQLDQGKLAASVAQAEANFKLAEANLKRSENLLENKTISKQEFDQSQSSFEATHASLELMKQQLNDSSLYAPFDGIAGARLVSPGQVISRGMTLTTLVSIDPIKEEFKVPERFLSQLQIGQTMAVSVATYPGQIFQGQVYFIDPRVDETTRTALLKARLPNPEHKLRPGMFGNLDLSLKVREQAIVIPETAVIAQSDKFSVFVVDQQQTAQARPVEVGLRLAGLAEITKGLQTGELVVTEGWQKLQPGAKVTVANPDK